MALRFFRQLYSLDTLDTRFVVPATATPKEALKDAELDPAGPLPTGNEKGKSRGAGDNVQPPRWNTAEFYVYYVSISFSIFMMVYLTRTASRESHPTYSQYSHLLKDGWIPGRKVVCSYQDNVPVRILTNSGQCRCSVRWLSTEHTCSIRDRPVASSTPESVRWLLESWHIYPNTASRKQRPHHGSDSFSCSRRSSQSACNV